MTRPYELVYIFDSALEEAQVQEHLDRFHALLVTPENPEPITAVSHWGKRTLAYSIGSSEVGYYVVEQFETDPESLPELERAIKLDESVLRHLIVLNEGLAPLGAATEASDEPGETEKTSTGDGEDA